MRLKRLCPRIRRRIEASNEVVTRSASGLEASIGARNCRRGRIHGSDRWRRNDGRLEFQFQVSLAASAASLVIKKERPVSNGMLIPRFSLRWLLAVMTICGVLAYIVSQAVMGRPWGIAVSVALGAL